MFSKTLTAVSPICLDGPKPIRRLVELGAEGEGDVSVDPFKIFMNAERFRRADVLLRSVQDPQIAVAVASPALVLSAFASELYLKSILVIEKGKAPGWHRLKNLFDL